MKITKYLLNIVFLNVLVYIENHFELAIAIIKSK